MTKDEFIQLIEELDYLQEQRELADDYQKLSED